MEAKADFTVAADPLGRDREATCDPNINSLGECRGCYTGTASTIPLSFPFKILKEDRKYSLAPRSSGISNVSVNPPRSWYDERHAL